MIIGGVVFVLVIGFSCVYFGYYWFIDVFVGWLFGVVWFVFVIIVYCIYFIVCVYCLVGLVLLDCVS